MDGCRIAQPSVVPQMDEKLVELTAKGKAGRASSRQPKNRNQLQAIEMKSVLARTSEWGSELRCRLSFIHISVASETSAFVTRLWTLIRSRWAMARS